MKVGFIGVGVMGGPMALNILKGGHALTVYDLSPEAVARLTGAGASAAASPREVGAASEVVVTMLPEPHHVEQVVLGPNGVAEGLQARRRRDRHEHDRPADLAARRRRAPPARHAHGRFARSARPPSTPRPAR